MKNMYIYVILIYLCVGPTNIIAEKSSNLDEINNTASTDLQSMELRLNTMCGPNCIWQIAKAHGIECTLEDIAKNAGTNPIDGTTVNGMLESCKKIGLQAQAVKTNIKTLSEDPRVAIVLLKSNKLMHYMIIDEINDKDIRLLDATKFAVISRDQFKTFWSGVAILIGDDKTKNNYNTYYWGRSFQIIGLLLLLIMAIYYIKSNYIKHLHKGNRHISNSDL